MDCILMLVSTINRHIVQKLISSTHGFSLKCFPFSPIGAAEQNHKSDHDKK